MTRPIRVVQYGLGPIGLACCAAVLDKYPTGRVELVGAIDVDTAMIGLDVSVLLGRSQASGAVVSADASRVLEALRPDVVLHTTSSFLPAIVEQLRQCAESGVHVVSSTEELFFPFDRHPAQAHELDALACNHGVVLLGTGVNPGFAMDTLALMATGTCTEVTAIRVSRVVDASKRRLPLQRKIGAGITPEEFEARRQTGVFGHIGLRESLLFVADGLGWVLDRVEEVLDPVFATADIVTPHVSVAACNVAGIQHRVAGFVDDRSVLTLDLRMYVGAGDPHDAVFVDGVPPVDLVIRGGLFGDTATVAALVNAIPLVMSAAPGLRTMADLPVPRAFATRPS
jgi:2,4-diaminopentanoate dehydrogenase